MSAFSGLKSIDFYRKIPRDLTEATFSGAGLSIIAGCTMVFLLLAETAAYLSVTTSTKVVVDRSDHTQQMHIYFNITLPRVSCEYASLDVHDVLGHHRVNVTKNVGKYSVDSDLKWTGRVVGETHAGQTVKHMEKDHHMYDLSPEDVSFYLDGENFEEFHQKYDILVVNFYAPWCPWCRRLAPAWEHASKTIFEKYTTENRIGMSKIDCTDPKSHHFCHKHHIQGFPSIRVYRKGIKSEHEYESYIGDRTPEALTEYAENLLSEIGGARAPEPPPVLGFSVGCNIVGHVEVSKVPGRVVFTAHSQSHSFDFKSVNVSHVVNHFSFGEPIAHKQLRRVPPDYVAMTQRLDGASFAAEYQGASLEHYMKVVLTTLEPLSGPHLNLMEFTTSSNQYHSDDDKPVAKFTYDLSPMQVVVKEESKAFYHFLTSVCAIIGGVFTVAGIIDSTWHNAARILIKKMELGKQN